MLNFPDFNFSELTFLEPEWGALFLLVLLYGLITKRVQRQQRHDLKGFCEVGSRPWHEIQNPLRAKSKRQWFTLTALALIVCASMRPAWDPKPKTMSEDGRDLIFILDVSKSMLAQDSRPNRLSQAKGAIAQAIGHFPNDRYGLLAFAGSPSIRSPLTEDHSFFLQALEETDPYSTPQGGTRIEDALYKVVDKLVSPKQRQSTDLYLITDGDDLGNLPQKSIDLINQHQLRVVIIGLGDSQRGARIPTDEGDGFIKYRGREVWSKHRPEYLQQLADRFDHGLYFNVGRERLNLELMIQQLRLKWQGESRSIGEKMIYQEGASTVYIFALIALCFGLGLPRIKSQAQTLSMCLISLTFWHHGELQAGNHQHQDSRVPQSAMPPEISPSTNSQIPSESSRRSNNSEPSPAYSQREQELQQAYEQKPNFALAWELASHYAEHGYNEQAVHHFEQAQQHSQNIQQAVAVHVNIGLCWIKQAQIAENIPMDVILEMMENEEEPIPPSTYYELAMTAFRKVLRQGPHQRCSDLLSWCHQQVYLEDQEPSDEQERSSESSSESESESQEQSDQEQQSEEQSDDENTSSSSKEDQNKNSDQSSDASRSISSAQLDLPPPAANPEDLLRMQEESQLQRQKSTKKSASKVEKDW